MFCITQSQNFALWKSDNAPIPYAQLLKVEAILVPARLRLVVVLLLIQTMITVLPQHPFELLVKTGMKILRAVQAAAVGQGLPKKALFHHSESNLTSQQLRQIQTRCFEMALWGQELI